MHKILELDKFYEEYRKKSNYSKYDKYCGVLMVINAFMVIVTFIILMFIIKTNNFFDYILLIVVDILIASIPIYFIFVNTIYKKYKSSNTFINIKNIINKKYSYKFKQDTKKEIIKLLKKHDLYSKEKIKNLIKKYEYINSNTNDNFSLILSLISGIGLKSNVLITLTSVLIIYFQLKGIIKLVINKNNFDIINDLIIVLDQILVEDFLK